jgi:uncharacterized protein YndB with AHSA1/START domain
MKNNQFVIERILNAPTGKVWKAITDKNDMKKWYFDIGEFKPEVGFEFQFLGRTEEKEYLHLCKISEAAVNKKLSYSWRYDGYEGISFVTFELFDEGPKTKIKLIHKGLETFSVDNPDFAKENFKEGWNYIICTALKNFVETIDN